MKKFICVLMFLILVAAAHSQQKFALVIGNENYTSITKLNNPVNDAADMQAALESIGFTVDMVTNGSLVQMKQAVSGLKEKLRASPKSYGFFFYSGHGVQSKDENFLIPVEANIQEENLLAQQAMSLQFILDECRNARNELNVVVLDSCRDNPFNWKTSVTRGLNTVRHTPVGSIVFFATSKGSKASDGSGRNGLLTAQLLKHIKTPDIEAHEMFRRAAADVVNASNGGQYPELLDKCFQLAYLGKKDDSSDDMVLPQESLYKQLAEAGGTVTITATKDETFTSNVTLVNAGAITLKSGRAERTISGGSIKIESGVTLILENITLKGVEIEVNTGGTLVMNDGAAITDNAASGVNVYGTFTMNGGTISRNRDKGVYVDGGTFTMNGGVIANNSGFMGGGVTVTGNGTFTLKNGRIENNASMSGGGGVNIWRMSKGAGNFTMQGGVITGNRANSAGGGIYYAGDSSFNMSGGIIAANQANGDGGGLCYIGNGTANISGGTIYGADAGSNANKAAGKGSASYVNALATNGTIQ